MVLFDSSLPEQWESWAQINYHLPSWQRKLPSIEELKLFVTNDWGMNLHALCSPGEALQSYLRASGYSSGSELWPPANLPPIFFLPTKEFIYELVRQIVWMRGVKRVVEVCAGQGLLGRHLREVLRKYDIEVFVTDAFYLRPSDEKAKKLLTADTSKSSEEEHAYFEDFCWADGVEPLTAQEAVRKYNPQVTIAAWSPLYSMMSAECINHESVWMHFEAGEGPGGCTASEDLWNTYNHEWNEKLTDVSCGRTDYRHNNVYHFFGKAHPKYGKYALTREEMGEDYSYSTRGGLIEGTSIRSR